jgi:homoserine O-acetyltransferase
MIHAARNAAATRIQAVGGVRTLIFEASAPLQLASGAMVSPLTIAFETYGALNAERTNSVLVCHDLTSDQFVASPNPISGRPAWWPRVVGPGRPIDTNRFFVICANVLGGCMGTTGPSSPAPDGQPYAMRFPAITVADMVRAQAMLVEALGIQDLFLVIGGGLGGMQALQWAGAYPKRTFACAAIATAARRSAQNIALNELGRQAIMADPDWRNGDFLAAGVRPVKGLSVARLAVRSASEAETALTRKLEKLPVGRDKITIGGEAEGAAEGLPFTERFDANSFLYLTRAMDHFDLADDFGGQLGNAFRDSPTRACVFAFSSDWRYRPEASRAIVRALIAAGADASYVETESGKGHDAFLLEEPAFEAALTGFIDSAAAARALALQGTT